MASSAGISLETIRESLDNARVIYTCRQYLSSSTIMSLYGAMCSQLLLASSLVTVATQHGESSRVEDEEPHICMSFLDKGIIIGYRNIICGFGIQLSILSVHYALYVAVHCHAPRIGTRQITMATPVQRRADR